MHSAILQLTVWIGCMTLFGCASRELDPAGEARTKVSVTDSQIASLQEPVSLAELERIFGPAEGQPGPRVTYRSADHRGEFFWVYYFHPQHIPEPTPDDTIVHHIFRADRGENGEVVVWPPRWVGKPTTVASSDLGRLYDESTALKARLKW